MTLTKRVLISISKIYPDQVKKQMKQSLTYAGVKRDIREYLGLSLLSSLLFMGLLLLYDLLFRGFNLTSFLISLAVFSGAQGVFIIYPYFKTENRARQVNKHLPDFLNLMAANIRSGMTPLSAMMGAAKEDFGVLSEEVSDAIAFSFGSESYESILKILVKRIKSTILDRIVKLLIIGMKTGGNMSSLLEGASEEVVQMATLRRKLVTSVRSYMLFITIVIIAGLPFLLTVSTYFVQTVEGLRTMVAPSELTQTTAPTGDLDVGFLNIISYAVIIITTFFASLLIGSVVDESYVQGLKYFVPMLAISLLIYVLVNNALPGLIGTPF